MAAYVQERRRHIRVGARVPLQFKDIQRPIETYSGTLTKDIGEGGVRFICGDFLSVFTRLLLEVSLPSFSRPIKAISKVAWIQKQPRGNQYDVGLKFLDMTEEDRKHLAAFIAKTPSPQRAL